MEEILFGPVSLHAIQQTTQTHKYTDLPGEGSTLPSHHHHPFCQSPMSSIHWIQSQCGAYILGKTILICVKKIIHVSIQKLYRYICRSIKAVGGAVVMVSAATLHQIVTPELSSVHHPPMSWSLAADDNSPSPRVTSGAWMIIILAIDLQISPQTIRSLQNNFLSELF